MPDFAPHPAVVVDIDAGFDVLACEGASLRAYRALPRRAEDTDAAVVLAMHLWGLDASTQQAARSFARAGIATLVPDLYARLDAPDANASSEPGAFVPFARRLAPESVDAALLAAAAWLRERLPRTRVGIAGFCMGGAIALRRSVTLAGSFSAVAVWYGDVAGVDPAAVGMPLVASFAADDHGIPEAAVTNLRDGLRVPHDVAVYPGAGHAFCDETRPSYAPGPAADSWRRTLAFLRLHLGGAVA